MLDKLEAAKAAVEALKASSHWALVPVLESILAAIEASQEAQPVEVL